MGIRLLNTAASTPVTYTFRADSIGKSRCILLRPVRRMSETVMTGVLHQDSSRHGDTVGVEKDTRRSCPLRITVHIAAWHGGAARQVRPSQAAGQRTAREAGRPDGEKRTARGCSDVKATGWRSSGLFGWQCGREQGSGQLGRQGGRLAKKRHGLGRAGREWSCALMTVRSAGQGKGATHERGAGGRFRLAKGRVADCAEMKRAMGREAHGSFLWKTEVFLEG